MGGLEREGLKNGARFMVVGAVRGLFVEPELASFDLGTSGDMQNNKNNNRVWHFLPV